MTEKMCANKTLENCKNPLATFHKGFVAKLRGPKDQSLNRFRVGKKPRYPSVEDIFTNNNNSSGPTPSPGLNSTNSINSIRGGHQISFNINEIDQESNNISFFDWILKNRNKLYLIAICGTVIYLCFANRKFLKKFLKKFKKLFVKINVQIKKISSCRIINNRLTRGLYAFYRCTNRYTT
jgi:hypothetical protein